MLVVQEIYYGCPKYFFRNGRFIIVLKQSAQVDENDHTGKALFLIYSSSGDNSPVDRISVI